MHLRIIYERFTSCCGCQLTLLNCEAELARLGEGAEFVDFSMGSSRKDDGEGVDLAIIEGSVSRPEELARLLELRRRARILAAIGACALTGGVNALVEGDRRSQMRRIYGSTADGKETFPPQPLRRFVTVDLEIAGCPPEGKEILWAVGALRRGGLPALPEYAVCLECRMRENLCLLIEGKKPCLGPVTRAGCDALCPSRGIVCEGCRGPVAEGNRGEEARLLRDLGLSEKEIRARMSRFSGVDHEDHPY